MKLIVGLGNPGEKYAGVRHNLGFMVVDELVKKMDGGKWKMDKKFKAEILKIGDILLAKPQTYMNNSGLAAKLLTSYYHLLPSDLIVIHDDLDILLGKVKVRKGGAAAGHHGVESIISAIGDDFWRVRVGIGNDKSHSGEHKRVHFDAEHFVLDNFTPKERSAVKHAIKQATNVILDLIEDP